MLLLPKKLQPMREFIGQHGVGILALGNTCLLSGYLMSDPTYLRALCATGSTLGILFNITRIPPIWPNVGWGVVFVLANAGMLVKLLLEDVGIKLDSDELSMYEAQFMTSDISPRKFKELLKLGQWRTCSKGEHLCEEGKFMSEVFLLHQGKVSVRFAGPKIEVELAGGDAGAYLGEASFLEKTHMKGKDNEISIATVTALENVRYYVWDSELLRSKLEKDQSLSLKTTIAFSLSLVNKLRIGKDSPEPTYDEVLAVALADGRVPPEEKRALRAYRERHRVSHDQHMEALKNKGWSTEEHDDDS